ncbi:MAG: efflux RND transporter periplasmic adaptor subunit [Candidatus Gribaldobacteria bacterium]|nr:efflux RND transporter periplasmic adaptor subunit [Candidatus Gribaldobacteria bacterium]
MFKKIFIGIKKRKKTAILILIVVGVGAYFGIRALTGGGTQTKYVLSTVERGTLITTVSGSGQTSASNQVDIKFKVSGEILNVAIKSGQTVKAGALLAQVDSTDAQKTVRDAQVSLESAQLSLEKLKNPATDLEIMQSENSLAQAKEAAIKADSDLQATYDDGFNAVTNAFLDLPGVMTGLNDILFTGSFDKSQSNLDYYADRAKVYDEKATQFRDVAYSDYQKARTSFDQNFSDYKSVTRFSSTSSVEALVDQTYATARNMAEAVKSANNLIQFYVDKLNEHSVVYQSLATTQMSSLNGYTSKATSHLSSLFSIQQSLKSSENALLNAQRSVAEKTISLAELKAGADALDLRTQELAVGQKQNALQDTKDKLADYYLRAPFDATVASVEAIKGDTAVSGGVVATLITSKRMAEIALNEVDITKVNIGQKVNITFDAIEGLNITGEVTEMDSLGAVSQGVVTYNVKIIFDTQDDRIKPGMSLSCEIITNAKQDVVLVANSAIKTTTDQQQYVEMPTGNYSTSSANQTSGVVLQSLPKQQIIKTGLANDTMTEVTEGLNAGDLIISKTIQSSISNSSSQLTGQSLLNVGGARGGFGGR